MTPGRPNTLPIFAGLTRSLGQDGRLPSPESHVYISGKTHRDDLKEEAMSPRLKRESKHARGKAASPRKRRIRRGRIRLRTEKADSYKDGEVARLYVDTPELERISQAGSHLIVGPRAPERPFSCAI